MLLQSTLFCFDFDIQETGSQVNHQVSTLKSIINIIIASLLNLSVSLARFVFTPVFVYHHYFFLSYFNRCEFELLLSTLLFLFTNQGVASKTYVKNERQLEVLVNIYMNVNWFSMIPCTVMHNMQTQSDCQYLDITAISSIKVRYLEHKCTMLWCMNANMQTLCRVSGHCVSFFLS